MKNIPITQKKGDNARVLSVPFPDINTKFFGGLQYPCSDIGIDARLAAGHARNSGSAYQGPLGHIF
jgi:hypothetical protein